MLIEMGCWWCDFNRGLRRQLCDGIRQWWWRGEVRVWQKGMGPRVFLWLAQRTNEGFDDGAITGGDSVERRFLEDGGRWSIWWFLTEERLRFDVCMSPKLLPSFYLICFLRFFLFFLSLLFLSPLLVFYVFSFSFSFLFLSLVPENFIFVNLQVTLFHVTLVLDSVRFVLIFSIMQTKNFII